MLRWIGTGDICLLRPVTLSVSSWISFRTYSGRASILPIIRRTCHEMLQRGLISTHSLNNATWSAHVSSKDSGIIDIRQIIIELQLRSFRLLYIKNPKTRLTEVIELLLRKMKKFSIFLPFLCLM